jgi:hypothetical protein
MADCYPSDFSGPLPPGGYYCTTNTPSVFGAINSILQQTATTASQVRATLNQYQGKTQPPPAAPMSTASAGLGLLIIAVVIGLLLWLIVRELT